VMGKGCSEKPHRQLSKDISGTCLCGLGILRFPRENDRQQLKQKVPMLRSIQRWSDQLESMSQDCFDLGYVLGSL
jgi:hypothetical protein